MTSPATCTAAISPPCLRPVHAHELCQGHNRRRLRNLPVDVPLGRKATRSEVPLAPLNLRVEARVVAALSADGRARGVSTGAAAAEVLRRWERRQS